MSVKIFREWSPCIGLLRQIPLKYHKNLIPYDLYFTCIAAHTQFLALGTNIGLVYWYNRHNGKLTKLGFMERNTLIRVVSFVESVDFMLAAGNKRGTLTVFQIPKVKEDYLPQTTMGGCTNCFHIEKIHTAEITSLAWSVNGERLFSGDKDGLVCMTEVDFFGSKTATIKLCHLDSAIIQLSYSKGALLVSSMKENLFCYPNSENRFDLHTAGRKSRQVKGAYGGVIKSRSDSHEVVAYVSRPNCRMYEINVSNETKTGKIIKTITFKSLIQQPHVEIPLINPAIFTIESPEDFLHLRQMEEFIVAYDSKTLHILNVGRRNIRVEASCSSLRSIMDVSITSEDEIFVLEDSRSLIRLASFEDKYENESVWNSNSTLVAAEGGPGLENISSFLTNSGQHFLNKFPVVLSTGGDIGALLFGSIDVGEEAKEITIVRKEEDLEEERDQSEMEDSLNLRLELGVSNASTSSLPIKKEEELKENELLESLNIKKFLPSKLFHEDKSESSSTSVASVSTTPPSSSEDTQQLYALGRISIDKPLEMNDDEEEVEEVLPPLAIEIRCDPLENSPNWTRISGSGRPIIGFALCENYVIIQDESERTFVSYRKPDKGLKFWVILRGFPPWQKLALSPDGRIMWRLYKTKVFALKNLDVQNIPGMKTYEWNEISNSGVADFFLSNDKGWILYGLDKTLIKHVCISSSRPFDSQHFIVRSFDEDLETLLHVSENDEFFAADVEKRIYSFEDKNAQFWNVKSNELCHKKEVSFAFNKSNSVERVVIIQPESLLIFLDTKSELIYRVSVPFLSETSNKQISFYDDGLWICGQSELYFNEVSVECHSWKEVTLDFYKGRAQKIYGDGIYANQGVIWFSCFSSSPKKELHFLNLFAKPPLLLKKIRLPTKMENPAQISSSTDYVWLLTMSGCIYIRGGITPVNPAGNVWTALNLDQLKYMDVTLSDISLGNFIVWAVDKDGRVFMRLGSHAPPENFVQPAWITLDEEYGDGLKPYHFIKIYATNSISIVWAIDDEKNVYARTGITLDYRLGTKWAKIPTPFEGTVELAIGSNYIWALTPSGQVYERIGITEENPEGLRWELIPSIHGSSITSSICGHLFVLDSEGKLQSHSKHSFKVQNFIEDLDTPKITDGDWTLL